MILLCKHSLKRTREALTAGSFESRPHAGGTVSQRPRQAPTRWTFIRGEFCSVLPADVAPDSRHRRRHLPCISSQFTTVNPRRLFAFGIAFVSVRRGKKCPLKVWLAARAVTTATLPLCVAAVIVPPAVFVIVQLDFDEPPSRQPVISSVCHCAYAVTPPPTSPRAPQHAVPSHHVYNWFCPPPRAPRQDILAVDTVMIQRPLKQQESEGETTIR